MALIDTLMEWGRRLSDRLRHPGQSVQYELQRMTAQGGWENFYADPNYDHATAFSTPPPQPHFDADAGYPPGKYRCLKRVDGRIHTIVWTVESSAVDDYYAEWRAREADTNSDTTATDGGSATENGAGNGAGSATDSTPDAELDPFVQQLMTDVKDGSTPALVALGLHEYFADDAAADDDESDSSS